MSLWYDLLMPDNVAPERENKAELKDSIYPGIQFEPAIHSTLHADYQMSKVAENLLEGDLTSHIWNKDAAKRMSEYQPQIISIDGLQPQPFFTDLTFENKVNTWMFLPNRPKAFNNEGEIYVIAGDFRTHAEALSLMPETDDLNSLISKLSEKVMEDNYSVIGQAKQVNDPVIFLGIGGLIGTALRIAEIKTNQNTIKPETEINTDSINKQLSRRSLLKAAAYGIPAVTTGWAFSSTIAGQIAARADTGEAKDFWQSVITATRPRFRTKELVKARTALLIEKTQETVDSLGFPTTTPSSILMGYSHAYDIEELMNHSENRKDIIAKTAEKLVKVLEEVIKENDFAIDTHIAKNALLDYITKIDIIKVTDPGGPSHNPDLPEMINGLVSLEKTITSTRVEGAISHLRKF